MKYLVLLALLILFTSMSSFALAAQMDEGYFEGSLQSAPATQSEIQDEQGDELSYVLVNQQVLITADVVNALDRQLAFAYIVQIQDETGTVLSLAWLTGSLSPNQSLSPALSWIPEHPGTYHTTIFIWEGINNPTALSPTLDLEIDVRESDV